jgi:hypothetical protein
LFDDFNLTAIRFYDGKVEYRKVIFAVDAVDVVADLKVKSLAK